MSQTPAQKAAAAAKAAATKAADPAASTDPATSADDLVAIVFMRSHPGYAYHPDNKSALTKEHTDLLVEGGFARYDEAETAEAPTDETR